MKKEDIFNRISLLVDTQADGQIAKFARMIGSGDQTVRSIVKYNRNFPGYEFLLNILHAFEWLNPEWLLLGEGEMIKSNHDPNVVSEPVETCRTKEDQLLNIIESQQRTIENLSKRGINTAEDVKTVGVKKVK